ncbi:class I SAM-dependent methyltransferase [Nitrosospira sp. NpAV]|uniref:class I SAM-dependent methyltransferase n=1 Tax=Nitrosospira sp. NpAV TaxID=58133 RepID=UPI0005A138CC|nr:class I SAM-dependent methyltransferase [Nitrosospira sp. NpAV]KIO50146.1 methyltransferase [Nitrosospira sp. NpAV]
MDAIQQRENPEIKLVESNEEVTLYIDDGQAMQGWERALMWESADILCGYGAEFLEVGLGLGISALRIAANPVTRHHTVIEKFPRVIELFRERNPSPPSTLEIVHADFFEYIQRMEPESLDGIFFDPYLVPVSLWDDEALWMEVMPAVTRALRRGGVFIPCFSTRPVLRWQFVHHFDRIIVERRSYASYETTDYVKKYTGDAYIQCFVRT